MPYRRPRIHSSSEGILKALNRADWHDSESSRARARAAGLIAAELAAGKTRVRLAAEYGWTVNDIRRALRGASVPIPNGEATQ
jgi:predicted transcriptional regulator